MWDNILHFAHHQTSINVICIHNKDEIIDKTKQQMQIGEPSLNHQASYTTPRSFSVLQFKYTMFIYRVLKIMAKSFPGLFFFLPNNTAYCIIKKRPA